ncbi:hypothetical protein EFW17_18750 [Halostreptopolyspora alba]|uniref:Uncharacterized protein n=1 Tax=Halostreptopolyspora alba TaxID=2487137 RepID=A0A3N0E3U8_9ACTN|nr:hypothetical protein EFW17_18750 [Nocardiopsaceae bacterium YIM 96095]
MLLLHGYLASVTLDPLDFGVAAAMVAVLACQTVALCRGGGGLVVVAHVLTAAVAVGVVAVHAETALTWMSLLAGSSGDVPGPRFAIRGSALVLGCVLFVLSVLGTVGAVRGFNVATNPKAGLRPLSGVAAAVLLVGLVPVLLAPQDHATTNGEDDAGDVPGAVQDLGWQWAPPGDMALEDVHATSSGALAIVEDGVFHLTPEAEGADWRFRIRGQEATAAVTPDGEIAVVEYRPQGRGDLGRRVVLETVTGDVLADRALSGQPVLDSGPDPIGPRSGSDTEALVDGGAITNTVLDTVQVWDLLGGGPIWTFEADPECSLTSLLPAEGLLYVAQKCGREGSEELSVTALDAATGERVEVFGDLAGRSPEDVLFRPDTDLRESRGLARPESRGKAVLFGDPGRGGGLGPATLLVPGHEPARIANLAGVAETEIVYEAQLSEDWVALEVDGGNQNRMLKVDYAGEVVESTKVPRDGAPAIALEDALLRLPPSDGDDRAADEATVIGWTAATVPPPIPLDEPLPITPVGPGVHGVRLAAVPGAVIAHTTEGTFGFS